MAKGKKRKVTFTPVYDEPAVEFVQITGDTVHGLYGLDETGMVWVWEGTAGGGWRPVPMRRWPGVSAP